MIEKDSEVMELTPQQAAFAMRHLSNKERDAAIIAAGRIVYDARHWHRDGKYPRL